LVRPLTLPEQIARLREAMGQLAAGVRALRGTVHASRPCRAVHGLLRGRVRGGLQVRAKVTVRGAELDDGGMLTDFRRLKDEVRAVLEELDH